MYHCALAKNAYQTPHRNIIYKRMLVIVAEEEKGLARKKGVYGNFFSLTLLVGTVKILIL